MKPRVKKLGALEMANKREKRGRKAEKIDHHRCDGTHRWRDCHSCKRDQAGHKPSSRPIADHAIPWAKISEVGFWSRPIVGATLNIAGLTTPTMLTDPSVPGPRPRCSKTTTQQVIKNHLSKQLCLRMFPEISSVARVIEVENMIEPVKVPDNSREWECLERDHRVYSFLARGLASSLRKDCILEAIAASSTYHYPRESIHNTLEPSDMVEQRASYWSSVGESDPAVPEMLLYELISKLCIIFEIHIQPFQG
ncbi:hypothetical protein ACSBR2_026102 [Camellia fascicularis]